MRARHLIVLLHGLGGDAHGWFTTTEVVQRLHASMRCGELPPSVILLPSGGVSYWADWADGHHAYASAVMVLVTAVSARRGLDASPEAGAIIGASMGGFGALSIGLQHPERFGTIIALSPTDLEIAVTDAPKRTVYLNVLGSPVSAAQLARINPRHLVARGCGTNQQLVLGWGDAEARKFAEGGQRLAKAARAAGIALRTRIVVGGRHGWASTWNQLYPWWSAALRKRFSAIEPLRPTGKPIADDPPLP